MKLVIIFVFVNFLLEPLYSYSTTIYPKDSTTTYPKDSTTTYPKDSQMTNAPNSTTTYAKDSQMTNAPNSQMTNAPNSQTTTDLQTTTDSQTTTVEFNSGVIIIVIIIIFIIIIIVILKCKNVCCQPGHQYEPLEQTENDKSIDNRKNKSVACKPGGIRNNSTICYMISIVQAIAASKIMMSTMRQLLNNKDSILIKTLFRLCNDINEGRSQPTENSKELVKIANEINWTKSAQQDAFDLLSKLINAMYKDYNQEIFKSIAIPPKLKMLHSYSKSIFKNRVQDHLGLSLALIGNYQSSPGVQIEHLIEHNFKKITIDDDPTFTTYQTIFGEVPRILLLHIQANFWNKNFGRMEKANYHIKYREFMELELDISSKDTSGADVVDKYKVVYELKSLVTHGGNIDGGHYMTVRKNCDKWWVTNDDQVASMNFKFNIAPYIMFYDRRSSNRIKDSSPKV